MIILKKLIIILLPTIVFALFMSGCLDGIGHSGPKKATVKIIFDTDISSDWDDVGAVAVLHSLANSGEADILAMCVSVTGEGAKWGAPCLDAINTFYHRPNIPIGVLSRGLAYNNSFYSEQLAREFPYDIDTIWDATDLYRKVLSEQPDSSVVFVTTGYMTNIANLLESKPDRYSKLSGIDLVRRKVIKMVSSAGRFPEGGYEYNLSSDVPSAKMVLDTWPRPILFSGYKVGSRINSGKRLPYLKGKNPVARAFELASCKGCCNTSFDQTAVLAAVIDPDLYWDIVPEGYTTMSANPEIGIQWHPIKSIQHKNHAYLVEKVPARFMEDIIEDLMMDLPNATRKTFFTLPYDNRIELLKGNAFAYKLPYYSYSKGDITITYKNVPDWIEVKNDSVVGTAPSQEKAVGNTIQAILYENSKPVDTANLTLAILNSQNLVTNVITASGCCQSIKVEKLGVGDKVYPDRPFKLQSIPGKYSDFTWISAPTNDGHRYDLGDNFISFFASTNVTVVVGYDNDFIELKPTWLNNWSDTGEEIVDDSGHSFHLFQNTFPRGKVILGNNTAKIKTLRLMYLILVKEKETVYAGI